MKSSVEIMYEDYVVKGEVNVHCVGTDSWPESLSTQEKDPVSPGNIDEDKSPV